MASWKTCLGELKTPVSTTLDLYVGEWAKRRENDSGTRLAAIYAGSE